MGFIIPPVTGEAEPLGNTDPSSCPKGRERHEGEGRAGAPPAALVLCQCRSLTETLFRWESLLFHQNGPRNIIVFQRFCFIVLEEGLHGVLFG